ncbi:MAG: hypothetical protein ACP5QO_03670 [Clostridia bacterium]
MESLAAPPLAIVKVGSTSVSVLVAGQLDDPLYQTARIRRLLGHWTPEQALLETLDDILAAVAPYRCQSGLVAFGEVGRAIPALPAAARARGFPVWTLSGLEEGQASWWGEQRFCPAPITVIDIGGGSTEIVGPAGARSLPVGAERPPGADMPLSAPISPHIPTVAMGGTARALGQLFGSPLHREVLFTHWGRDPSTWPGVDQVAADRIPLLAGGLATLLWVMDGLSLSQIAVTDRDLRWGLWLAARLGRAGGWPGG